MSDQPTPDEAADASPGPPVDATHHSAFDALEHHVPPPHELGPVQRFDAAISGAFDRWRGTEPADRILYAVTELGDFGLVWLLIGATRALGGEDRQKEAVRLTAALAAESVLVNGVVKQLFKRERPVNQKPRPHRMRIPLTTSFPSGHASSAMLSATLLADRSRVGPLWYGLGALVGASRVYVEIHHPSDVLGGYALGLVLGRLVKRAWPLPDPGAPGWRARRPRRR